MRVRFLAACGVALVLGLMAAGARPVQADIAVQGPAGWQAMCRATPVYCNRLARDGAAPALTRTETGLLREVNRAVNRAIRVTAAPPGLDAWRVAPAEGDCVDFALTKKHVLLARGWSPQHLRFASVLTETGEPHAVLLVDTAEGPLVLDNRRDRVLPWAQVSARGYMLLAVEGEGPRGQWRATPEAALAMLVLTGGNRPGT
jgi:predicted transglutaminase-like cysteine proteinase